MNEGIKTTQIRESTDEDHNDIGVAGIARRGKRIWVTKEGFRVASQK